MKKIIIIFSLFFSLPIFAADASIANIPKHYAALPSLYNFEETVKEQLNDKISRQYVMGSQSMLVKWTLLKGAIVPMQFHAAEQITWITQGAVTVVTQGKKFIVKAGQVIIIPPFVPHEFTALEDTIDIDFFTPVREDWLRNAAKNTQPLEKQ
jgi:quercetin dioxygenase-like cupin family protein